MSSRVILTLSALALGTLALAQSGPPRGKASATIGGGKVVVDYGRPALEDRTVAELLKELPGDRIWRTGRDQVTTLTTDRALTIGGKNVPPGTYSVYVHIPEQGNWSFILNEDLGVPLKTIFAQAPPELADEPWPYLQGYTEKIGDQEVVRAPMTKESVSSPEELFTITLEDSGRLSMAWGQEAWSIELKPAAS